MKRVLKIVMFVATVTLSQSMFGQQITPNAYNSNNKINYVRTWEPVKPYASDTNVMAIGRTLQEVRQATAYLDGLGRPLQIVNRRGSLITGDTARDLVSPVLYDAFGREQFTYLPFAANNTGGNASMSNGFFKLNPFQQDSAFNKQMFSDETYYYNKTVFESSPLNRVYETFAPGNSWVGTAAEGSESNRRGLKTKYWLNTVSDSVRIWTITDVSNSFGTYASPSVYAAGLLYKNVTADEHNNQVIEFTDKEGKVLLKKIQLSADADTGTGKNHTGWLCTYYLYDKLKRLRAVIQPKGVELLAANGWNMNYSSGVILQEQCFRYEYDSRGRGNMKKTPGTGSVHMIYDARDRQVMMQDSLLRSAQQWLYTQYDDLNRPMATGLMTDNSYYNNPAYHRSFADTSAIYPVAGTYTIDTLSKTFYDDYTWRTGQGNPLSNTRSSSDDGYLLSVSNTVWPYPQDVTVQSKLLKGAVTGTKTRVLGTNTYLYTVNFYDDKGKVIQTQSTNISGATDVMTMQNNWVGQPLLTIVNHQKGSPNPQTSILLTKISYDDLGRVTRIEKKISNSKVNSGSMPGSWTVINHNEYDGLGQLKKKKLGVTPIDSLAYEYNIRGWMLGMNRSYVKDTTSTTNWFGFDLGYDKTAFTVNGSSKNYAIAQYNGNIGGTLWKSTGDDRLRKLDFIYDGMNRLTGADFNQLTNNTFSKNAGVDFSVSGLNYDANGNILNMNQRGWKIGGSITIDSMLYTYIANSNRLMNVLDRKNDTATRLGDFRASKAYMDALSQSKTTSASDYSYDGNGNLNLDNNKDISNIHYNYLNMPDSIAVSGKGHIRYVYDAAGNKLKKVTTDGSKVTTTLYLLGNYINDTLQFIGTEEGRARPKDSSVLVYDYFIKDHLANVRMVLTEQKDTSFYPPASMEPSQGAIENALYDNITSTRVARPGGYPIDTSYTNPNDYVAMLNAGANLKIGPSIALKVMAGDKFNLRVSSWWKYEDSPGDPGDPFSELLSAMSNSIGEITESHGGPTSLQLVNSGLLQTAILEFLNNQSYDNTKPKAYVNWVVFDDQFNYISTGSGFDQIGENGEYKIHAFSDFPISKNGYLYIYTSNATKSLPVYFDNLQVTHIRGPLLEETHYYPFGLTMGGISSKALSFGNPGNKKNKFQNQELNDELGVNYYEFKWRYHDLQVGRFIQADPLSDKYVYNSTYAFSENCVTGHVELEGLEKQESTSNRSVGRGIVDGFKNFLNGIVGLSLSPGYSPGMGQAALKGDYKSGLNALLLMSSPTLKVGDDLNKFIKGDGQTRAEISTEYVLNAFPMLFGAKTSVAASEGKSVNLYRAMSEEEVTDIFKNGFRNKLSGPNEGAYETGKLFATSPSDAAQFGKNNFSLDQIPNFIMKAKVPAKELAKFTSFEGDGMKAISVPVEQLKWVKPIYLLNYSPKPTNPFNNLGW